MTRNLAAFVIIALFAAATESLELGVLLDRLALDMKAYYGSAERFKDDPPFFLATDQKLSKSLLESARAFSTFSNGVITFNLSPPNDTPDNIHIIFKDATSRNFMEMAHRVKEFSHQDGFQIGFKGETFFIREIPVFTINDQRSNLNSVQFKNSEAAAQVELLINKRSAPVPSPAFPLEMGGIWLDSEITVKKRQFFQKLSVVLPSSVISQYGNTRMCFNRVEIHGGKLHFYFPSQYQDSPISFSRKIVGRPFGTLKVPKEILGSPFLHQDGCFKIERRRRGFFNFWKRKRPVLYRPLFEDGVQFPQPPAALQPHFGRYAQLQKATTPGSEGKPRDVLGLFDFLIFKVVDDLRKTYNSLVKDKPFLYNGSDKRKPLFFIHHSSYVSDKEACHPLLLKISSASILLTSRDNLRLDFRPTAHGRRAFYRMLTASPALSKQAPHGLHVKLTVPGKLIISTKKWQGGILFLDSIREVLVDAIDSDFRGGYIEPREAYVHGQMKASVPEEEYLQDIASFAVNSGTSNFNKRNLVDFGKNLRQEKDKWATSILKEVVFEIDPKDVSGRKDFMLVDITRAGDISTIYIVFPDGNGVEAVTKSKFEMPRFIKTIDLPGKISWKGFLCFRSKTNEGKHRFTLSFGKRSGG